MPALIWRVLCLRNYLEGKALYYNMDSNFEDYGPDRAQSKVELLEMTHRKNQHVIHLKIKLKHF